MTYEIEKYKKALPVVPPEWPGIFRWKMYDSYGYPHLALEVWKPKKSIWTGKEIPSKGKWVHLDGQQIYFGDYHNTVSEKAEKLLRVVGAKYGHASNVMMADRGYSA